MGKIKKILAGVLVVAIAGSGITAGLMQLKKNSQKTVAVTPVSGLLQEFYTPATTLDGMITSSATQTVNGDKDLIIDQIYVTKGDAVKKGDPLISFDTTLVEMELNIAKLKRQKLEQDLNKAVNRLNSLQNGGPVEETDAGAAADNLNSATGSDNDTTGDDDMTPDDTMSSAADMSGNYLAAAFHPLLLSAFTDEGASDAASDNGEGSNGSTDTQDSQNTDESSDTTSVNDTPAYADPSANEFGDGNNDNSFEPGNADTPEVSPTPTPVLDHRTTYFDPYYRKGDPNITDGDEPFYQELDADSVPFTGSGTEDDPYVYLCSSAKEKVTVMGSFFNKLAGYSPDGTKVVNQGGYWYRLEFHQNDTIADYDDLKTSCTGYYLVNGSFLEKPVYEFAEVEFTLADADKYDENPDDGGDDNPGGNDVEPTETPVSRADAIKYQKSKIASLKLDLQESDIKISQLEKKANKKLISAKLDGTVTYVGDSGSGETTDGNALIKIKSSDGFYVVGSVSELMLDDFKEGTKLNCTSYTSGSFEAEVMDVSEYPVTGNSYYGNSNPNVSYYAFTAVVTDKTLQLEDQDWVTVNYEASAAENSMVIQKAFVRSDSSKNYVYKDDKGVLKKQEISVGATVDGGYSVIVKGGLSADDLIAFPYGKDVKEGAKTKEVTLDQMYGY
ncbi:hypothetical protein G4422_11330 [Blautia wexlerae]|uniref:hypothetical protein n=1 Tax=Blautia wexlerae TaxID=418240 RepID=UPI00156FAAE6|nr:hypothetical protein [Blautia wexlerae]NSE04007.1 hypothetical protein [Blautia wexlerae]NSF77808.1 hypothetical protein [Blautia wexlerae]